MNPDLRPEADAGDPEPWPEAAAWLRRRLDPALEAWTRRSPVSPGMAALLSILAIEFVLLASNARQLPFWYDELITLHYAGLRPFAAVVDALMRGMDTMTLGFMAIMYPASLLPGDAHVTLRLPVIAAYLLTLFGVFLFTRRRYGPVAALMAVLFIALSPFRPFGIEARPYALLTGFLAVAAACWQRIGERRGAAALTYVFFLLAISVHYYAALAIGCLVAAEGVYWLSERRVRWQVWGLVLTSAAMVAAQAPVAQRAKQVYGQSAIATPAWSVVLKTYTNYMALDINYALLLVVLASLVFPALMLLRWRATPRSPVHEGGFTPAELALAYSFVLYPAALVIFTIVMGSWYTPRYGWPVIAGLALLWAVVYSSVRIRIVSAALALAMALAFTAQVGKDLGKMGGMIAVRRPAQKSQPASLGRIARRWPELDIVVADGTAYVEMAYYSGHGLNSRLAQLVKPEASLRLTGEATVDIGNGQLARLIGLRVLDCDRYLATHENFLLYSTRRRSEWLTRYLIEQGYSLRVLSEEGGASFYLVSRG